MSFTIPTIEPLEFQAGDSLIFQRTLSDFPANLGWTLSYSLRHATLNAIDFTAGASGADFLVSVARATTAAWKEGTYRMIGYATSATERHVVYDAELSIVANVATATNYDGRTYAEKTLQLLEDAIAGRIGRTDISYSINGRSFTAYSHRDLLDARDYFRSQVANEKAIAAGQNRRILTRFKAPA